MALPTRDDCKDHLRIQTTAEDDLVDDILTRAKAKLEERLGYPFAAASRAYVEYHETDTWGQDPVLRLPGPFKTAAPVPSVVDVDGATVSSDSYTLDNREGVVRAKRGYSFPNRPYTITADIGLSAHPDYATRLEAVASQLILDLVAFWYLHRDPAEASHADEGGASQTVTQNAIPERILDSLSDLPGKHRLGIR